MNQVPDPGGTELVSVVIPAHNEEAFMAAAVAAVVQGMRQRGPFEMILVENGSTDATAEMARGLERDIAEVRAISMPDPDYGRALRAGLLAARGSTVVIFDMDFYDLEFFDRAMALIRGTDGQGDGPVIVVATKRGEGSVDTRVWSRRLVTKSFSLLLRYGFGLRVSDTHGMKVLRRQAVLVHAEACRFGTDIFDTELVLRAERAGLKVDELPVTVTELRPARTSIAKRIPRTLKNLALLRLAFWQERLRGVRP